MPANPEEFDPVYMQVAQRVGSVDGIFDSFFGFLMRKTDYFAGAKDKDTAFAPLKKAFDQCWEQAQQKKEEDWKRNKAKDEERKRKREMQWKKDAEEWAAKNAKMEVEEPKFEEVSADVPVGIVKEEPKESTKKVESGSPDTWSTSGSSSSSWEKPGKDAEEGDKAAEKEDDGPAPIGNGGTTAKYTWTQTLKTVDVHIPIRPGSKGKDILVDIKGRSLKVAYKTGEKETVVDGKLFDLIKVDDATWTLMDNKEIHIQLEKYNDMSWWSTVVLGDWEIDTKKIVPENSKLSDLDGDTRQTVEKMMYDQRAKQMGKPTSDQEKQHGMLDNFMKQHPEMDFSKCKINYGDNPGGFNFGG